MNSATLGWLLPGLLLGLAGGVHCTAMCGGACVGLASRGSPARGLGAFTGARTMSYVLAGAAAGLSAAWADQFARLAAWSHPLWMLVLALSATTGVWLLLAGRWPSLAGSSAFKGASRVWRIHPVGAAAFAGLALPALPCGLLYSALLLAGLSGGAWQGAAVMAGFAMGSAPWLLAAPLVLKRWHRLDARGGRLVLEAYAFRAVGLLILVSAGWSLWRAVTPNDAC